MSTVDRFTSAPERASALPVLRSSERITSDATIQAKDSRGWFGVPLSRLVAGQVTAPGVQHQSSLSFVVGNAAAEGGTFDVTVTWASLFGTPVVIPVLRATGDNATVTAAAAAAALTENAKISQNFEVSSAAAVLTLKAKVATVPVGTQGLTASHTGGVTGSSVNNAVTTGITAAPQGEFDNQLGVEAGTTVLWDGATGRWL